jgi:hypothetical protein
MSFVNELLKDMNFQTKPTNGMWSLMPDGLRADNKVWQATISTVKDTLSSCISRKFKSFHINEI